MTPSHAHEIQTGAASASVQDYAKAIYSLTPGPDDTASTNDLAEKLGISAGSVSAMIKKLDEGGLVKHVPYRGVRLTERGELIALTVLRRHRLLELFLTEVLEVPWSRVHAEAEVLEHAISDDLVERIARKLGDPAVDPHGDPIPRPDLTVLESVTEALSDLDPGERAVFVRISDSNSEMLSYLTRLGIAIGDSVEMVESEPFGGPCRVVADGKTHSLGLPLASAMRVQRS